MTKTRYEGMVNLQSGARRREGDARRAETPLAQGRELLDLIAKLRGSGAHPSLESVFKEVQGELDVSIEFVERMLADDGGPDHRFN